MPRRNPHSSTHTVTLIVALTLAVVGINAFTQALLSPTPPGTTLGTSSLAKSGDDSGSGGSGSGGGSGSSQSDSDDDESGSNDSSGSNNSGRSSDSDANAPQSSPEEDDEEDADENKAELLNVAPVVPLPFPVPAADRVRVRTQDDRTRIDITSGGIKVRLERRGDRVILRAKTESGEDIELDENELFKVEQRLAKSSLKLATPSENTTILQRGEVAALSTFPLSVDLATNTLTVTTPAGERQVAILPDQAVRNLLVAGVIDQLVSLQTPVDTSLSFDHLIEFALMGNLPVYQILGLSNQKLLGFIPVQIQKTVEVSADTGEVVDTQQDLTSTILDTLSI